MDDNPLRKILPALFYRTSRDTPPKAWLDKRTVTAYNQT